MPAKYRWLDLAWGIPFRRLPVDADTVRRDEEVPSRVEFHRVGDVCGNA